MRQTYEWIRLKLEIADVAEHVNSVWNNLDQDSPEMNAALVNLHKAILRLRAYENPEPEQCVQEKGPAPEPHSPPPTSAHRSRRVGCARALEGATMTDVQAPSAPENAGGLVWCTICWQEFPHTLKSFEHHGCVKRDPPDTPALRRYFSKYPRPSEPEPAPRLTQRLHSSRDVRDRLEDLSSTLGSLGNALRSLGNAARIDEDYKLEWEENKGLTVEFFEELAARVNAVSAHCNSPESPLD